MPHETSARVLNGQDSEQLQKALTFNENTFISKLWQFGLTFQKRFN